MPETTGLEYTATDAPGEEQGGPLAEAVEKSQDPKELAKTWLAAIALSEQQWDKWYKRGDKIIKRFRDEKEQDGTARSGSRFNIFWSNVQTLAPATYSRRPKVEVSRRFKDKDPVARVAGRILERALQYEVDKGLNFHETMEQVVLDRLLPGRGTAWLRYEPAFRKEKVQNPVPGSLEIQESEVEVISDEFTSVDYIYWKDLLVGPGRTWADVTWAAKKVYFSKEALAQRFGKSFARLGGDITTVPCNYDPITPDKTDGSAAINPGLASDTSVQRAVVYELWDKTTRQLVWVYKGGELPLDIQDDPLDLDDFWPFPRPLDATTTNESLIPVADFVYYQDQIRELDSITTRISLLETALRVIGVYDRSQPALATLLASGVENRMVPVDQWAAFAEKGGLKGVTDFLPLDMVAKVLQGLYAAREHIKQLVYEITGMSDILRGQSMASETLGAQEIKANFANLRLSARKEQVAVFVTHVLQIKAEIMCSLYTPETLLRVSSADQIEEAQSAPQLIQAAIALLKDERARKYRIEVMADSMVELDEAKEQERRNTFMQALGNFMNSAKNLASMAPEMMPVALEMLRFVIRGFRVGMALESSIDDASTAIMKRLAQPQQQGPSPEQVKMMIAKLQEDGETLRARLKEDSATDREELKAMVQLALQNMESRMQQVLQGWQSLDSALDRDAATEGGQPQGSPPSGMQQ